MLKSFTDSPNGLLKEIMVSVGAEYSYNQQFFVRWWLLLRECECR